MKCYDPVLCYTDQSGKRHLRHFSLASEVIIRAHQLVFDCGKCVFCRRKDSIELAARCVLHASVYGLENCFLTLTYDESREGYSNELEYIHIQKFKKSLRTWLAERWQKRCEIFNVHEYGRKGKKHWHLVVFGWQFKDREVLRDEGEYKLYTSAQLAKFWPFGFSSVGDISEASAMYCSLYMNKDFKHGHVGTAKQSKSTHSGIGRAYFLRHYRQILMLGYVPFSGKRIPLPRYFEKLAHKHWAHFYQEDLFWDVFDRKARYRPFKDGEASREIAELFILYSERKAEIVKDLEAEWQEVISRYVKDFSEPDFVKSAQNALYDLRNQITEEKF